MTDQTNETHQAKRTALLDKISALISKTELNGCTEAEALAAARLAEKLMTKYGLSLAELKLIQTPGAACKVDATRIGNSRAHEVLHLSPAIAFFTDTRCWFNRYGSTGTGRALPRIQGHHGIVLVYFGLRADVQIANYLTDTLCIMLDTEWSAFWKEYPKRPKPSARTSRASFMRGMTWRVSDRLREMKESQNRAKGNNCHEIVLAKAQIVQAAYETTFGRPKIKMVRQRGHTVDDIAWNAGEAAGDRVSISSGALEG